MRGLGEPSALLRVSSVPPCTQAIQTDTGLEALPQGILAVERTRVQQAPHHSSSPTSSHFSSTFWVGVHLTLSLDQHPHQPFHGAAVIKAHKIELYTPPPSSNIHRMVSQGPPPFQSTATEGHSLQSRQIWGYSTTY